MCNDMFYIVLQLHIRKKYESMESAYHVRVTMLCSAFTEYIGIVFSKWYIAEGPQKGGGVI